MAKLNEYLGSIISSITNARVLSDIQSVKVAEEYSKHPLLKHFAIPRMRIENVELTIPVALEAFEEKAEPVYEPIDNRAFNTAAYNELLANIGVSKLPAELSHGVISRIASETEVLERQVKFERNISPLTSFVRAVVDHLLEQPAGQKIIKGNEVDIKSLKSKLHDTLLTKIKPYTESKIIDHLNVIVEADKLREKKPESLVYIKMRISESGMEWHKMESSAGEIESKLLPE